MRLSGPQVKQIHEALLDGYSLDTLRIMVRVELGENLEAIAGPGALSTVAFSLIEWAERTGRVQDLIAGALAQQSGNELIRVLYEQSQGWGLAAPGGSTAPAAVGQRGPAPVFDQRGQRVDTQTNVAGDLVHGDKAGGDKVGGDKYVAEHITVIQGSAALERVGQPAATPSKAPPIGFEWVTIPAGEFLYGEDKQPVYLDAFQISRTPVTNGQYQMFVDATGHARPQHWQGRRVHPTLLNHPVVYVSWDDAQAFCEWAGVFLPTEQQWEKAARGTDGRIYPWGIRPPTDKLCNFNKNVGTTASVGRYSPNGDSPYGVVDMAGNAWEWCEDWHDSDCDSHTLRGGSWFDTVVWVRCACRIGDFPANRDNRYSFRVVRSPFS